MPRGVRNPISRTQIGQANGVAPLNPSGYLTNSSLIELPTADLTATGEFRTVTVDTNGVGFGAALFLNGDGNYDEADADQSTTMLCTALALETGIGAKRVLTRGYVRNDAWNWTPGQVTGVLFVSTTQGVLTQTAPAGTGDYVQAVGYAVTADIIRFDPQLFWLVIP